MFPLLTSTLRRFSFLAILQFVPYLLQAQAVELKGVINTYHTLYAIDDSCGRVFTIDTAGLKAGQRVLFYSAQGAQINLGDNSSYGNVIDIKRAGTYEIATIEQNLGFGVYRLTAPLRLGLTAADVAQVQVLTLPNIPQHAVVKDTIKAPVFNSVNHLGGIIALEVPGNLNLLAPILADGAGFAGGSGTSSQSNTCSWLNQQNGWVYPKGSWRGAVKGAGAAAFILGYEAGRGPQLNGGGGGNDHNSGGGGGGNGTRGGNGGQNNEPDNLGCKGDAEGEGGKDLDYPGRIFMGGGGGSGHANNGPHSNGGNGGGIIILYANKLIANGQVISANGTDGSEGQGDGAGGGGAAGTIICISKDVSQVGSLSMRCKGGDGADVVTTGNRCQGPGGGGGGGRVLTNILNLPIFPPGLPGVVTLSTNGCNGTTNGAKAGGLTVVNFLDTLPENKLKALTPLAFSAETMSICVGDLDTISFVGSLSQTQLELERNGAWVPIMPNDSIKFLGGNQLVFSNFTALSELNIRAKTHDPNNCYPVVYSDTLHINVITKPVISYTTNINGYNMSVQNNSQNYSGLLWDFGDGVLSDLINPSHTYSTLGTYNLFITLYSPCDTISSNSVVLIDNAPQAAFQVAPTLMGCSPFTLDLKPQFTAPNVTYRWLSPGAAQASSAQTNYTATYAQSGTYTITLIASNAAGLRDTAKQTVQIILQAQPVAAFTYTVSGTSGVVSFTNTSANATDFIWTLGNGNQVQSNNTAVFQQVYHAPGTYVVTLVASNGCGASVLQKEIYLQTVSMQEPQAGPSFKLYPNPAQHLVYIELDDTQGVENQILVYDALGRVVLRDHMQDRKHLLDLGHWPSGMYMVEVEGKGRAQLVKF